MTEATTARIPPRWLIRAIWRGHRLLVRLTDGRLGLPSPVAGRRMGMMRVHARGRVSGRPRPVVLGYFRDDDRLVTLAMNGWDPADPGWWRNLRAHPEARVDLGRSRRRMSARAAEGEERARLWTRFADYPGWGDIETFSSRRPGETAVVVFEPVTP